MPNWTDGSIYFIYRNRSNTHFIIFMEIIMAKNIIEQFFHCAGSVTGAGMTNCMHQSKTFSTFSFVTTLKLTNVISCELTPVLNRWLILITFLTSANDLEPFKSVLLKM